MTNIDDYYPEEEERQLTYEEVLAILEDELDSVQDPDNPYKPLNFHDTDEGFEE